jgi:GcrA cell cycle regulator
MTQLTWSEDRIEQLKKLWQAGLSASQIAAELGNDISRNAVIGKVHRLGLSGRRTEPTGSKKLRKVRRNSSPQPSRRVQSLRQAIAEASNDEHAANLEAAADFDPSVISVSDAEIPVDRRITSIVDLEETHCRWPIGEVGTESFYFCGADGRKLDGLPYCARHARIAYTSPAERRAISEEERGRRAALGRQMSARNNRGGRAA